MNSLARMPAGLPPCLALGALLAAVSCASFYEVNYEFNQNFELGNIEEAGKILDKNAKILQKKSAFLYQVNKGMVLSLLQEYESSNEYFEQAYLLGEDYHQNYLNIAASFLVNPTLIEYRGEDHEYLMLLYFKALNYLKLGDNESALVECRRLNNKLNLLEDRYKSDKKYRRDAFVHNLMGIIYEADGDYNNAFIAYRNAYNIYKEDYTELFSVAVPEQLKEDLLRSAYLMGFDEEMAFYEKEFDIRYTYQPAPYGELVFFWHNGLGPVKTEWSVNFSVVEGESGMVTFENEALGFFFPFPYDFSNDEGEGNLTDLEFFRVAFPQYVERVPTFDGAELAARRGQKKLELAENINAISFQVLKQRMLREFGQSLLRLALKKAAEEGIRREDEGLGFLVGVVNAMTEQADTRNWQTLPHSIYYARMPLDEGANDITLRLYSQGNADESEQFTFDGAKGRTFFQTFQTLY